MNGGGRSWPFWLQVGLVLSVMALLAALAVFVLGPLLMERLPPQRRGDMLVVLAALVIAMAALLLLAERGWLALGLAAGMLGSVLVLALVMREPLSLPLLGLVTAGLAGVAALALRRWRIETR